MSEALINPEISLISLTRSGAKKAIQLLIELDICSYWGGKDWMFEERSDRLFATHSALEFLGHFVPKLKNEEGLSFPESAGVKVSHSFDGQSFGKPIIRMVRDPRDAAISNFLSLGIPNTNFSLDCFLDQPLVPSQGGVFGLGMLEEWFLQEQLVSQFAESTFYLYFERMEQLDVEMIENLLRFLSLNRSRERINEALKSSLAGNFNEAGFKGSRVARWKTNEFPEINERASLIAMAVPNIHDEYEFNDSRASTGITTWNNEEFESLLKLFVNYCLEHVAVHYPEKELSGMMDPLVNLSLQIERLPLIQFYFARFALGHPGALQEKGKSVLKRLCSESSLFLKATSAIELERLGERDMRYSEIAKGAVMELNGTRHFEESFESLGYGQSLPSLLA